MNRTVRIFFFCVIGISLIKLPPEKSGTCLFVCWFLLSFYGWDRYDGGGPPLGGGVGDGWLARSFLSFWVGVSDRGIVGCFRLLGADGEKKVGCVQHLLRIRTLMVS